MGNPKKSFSSDVRPWIRGYHMVEPIGACRTDQTSLLLFTHSIWYSESKTSASADV